MKILLTIFEIQDYGGIVGDIEFLIKGFREHGHQVDLILLRGNAGGMSVRKSTGPRGSYQSASGGECNTLAGWYGIKVLGYRSHGGILEWRKMANTYDLVIHEIPGPKPDPEGYWRLIYDIDPPQLIAAHDAHFRDMYPHISLVADKIKGISCTNHAGYKSLEWYPGPRAFIGAAHGALDWEKIPPWQEKKKQAVCAHVWKAWKHMDQVVAATQFLDRSLMIMGGDGIEGRYMRSKDKCKPKYHGLWDLAKSSGHFDYRGLMTHEELFRHYESSRVMVDMSYSRKFHALGNHFNRSVIESYNNGVVPICTTQNMRENSPQVPLFDDGQTHIAVDHGITPEDLALTIDWAVNLQEKDVAPMIAKGRKILLDHFDYRKVCLEYLRLAKGEPAGIYPVLETGVMPEGFLGYAERFARGEV